MTDPAMSRLLPPTPGRARIMSSIRGTRNKTTELRLASALRKAGLAGWRRHQPLPGRPDFVFPRERVAVFVDGCFWHGCPRCYKAPARNAGFWAEKVQRNRARDRRVARQLRSLGWRVTRIWEHELASEARVIARVLRLLRKGAPR